MQESCDAKTEQSTFWFIKTLLLFLLIPFRMCGLYIMDIVSDIIQIISLYKNCHSDFSGLSFGIIMSSYFTTSLFIKFDQNSKLSKAFAYPVRFG